MNRPPPGLRHWWQQWGKPSIRWMILAVIAAVWVEWIRYNLWWILLTLLVAFTITAVAAGLKVIREEAEDDH